MPFYIQRHANSRYEMAHEFTDMHMRNVNSLNLIHPMTSNSFRIIVSETWGTCPCIPRCLYHCMSATEKCSDIREESEPILNDIVQLL